MAKRNKVATSHTSLRLPPELLEFVQQGAERAGWSHAKMIGLLAWIGVHVLREDNVTIAKLRTQYDGCVRIHRVELDNARRLAEARRETRTGSAPRARRKAAPTPAAAPPAK